MDDVKASLRLSHTVNDLSQELLELSGVDEGAVLDKDVAQAAYLLRTAVQALDAAYSSGNHCILLEPFGYHWFRIGLDYLLKRTEI
jgi:hypothetical protein